MIFGTMIQGVRFLEWAYHRLNPPQLINGTYYQSHPELLYVFWLIPDIGAFIFAIGLFLHAKNQRGLQRRVDELELILADMHSRER